MHKMKTWLFAASLVAFAVLLGLAIYYESTVYLYAASALPILIVIWLPDIERHQYIRPKHRKRVSLRIHSGGVNGKVTISFDPGFVRWRKAGKLYFHLDSLKREEAPETNMKPGKAADAGLPVLSYDLSAHPSKPGWIGIDLKQLAERTAGLSVTTDEVTRLTIRLGDLEEMAVRQMTNAVPVTSGSKQMQA
ncbi:hypothetical protein [Paenibacillus sp. EPM92]|uniref:hypothetical protein n=1 Tax=Paenibacillus sp. EPM92 TaxID=1561195 RepID=UPI00191613C9|nr:hypothetical protein [Paenibacillus sp. EPM92]